MNVDKIYPTDCVLLIYTKENGSVEALAGSHFIAAPYVAVIVAYGHLVASAT